ncbi:MAG TPA: AarF/UbiB family protein [Candidatus Angelobacter sp.]|jgi:ubiquinone biosynthesis protein|nr:AarF/UbiB family protein [Candidatus Angelobacter sp.]
MKAKASLSRFKDICRVAGRHIVLHALHQRFARWPKLARRIPGENLPGPKRFRMALEEIGGTFIKFGQMLAMQSDMLPLEYCAALFSLFDQVPPFEYAEVERAFREDLGQSPLEIFETFDPRPIATGSIGQVHVATLAGRKVAVKVRRPTILSDFDADIAAMRFTVNIVKLLHIRALYWIIAPTEEFIAWTQDELDYRREAHYIDELGRNARNNEHEKVPAVFWSCTTARILTAEFLEGMTVSEYLRQLKKGTPAVSADFVPQIFAARLIGNFLGDAFRHGMFHADLHPGNLMIMPGNVVGYIDFGISGVLSPYSRRHLISMTLAYARGDLDAMCESFFRITTLDGNADPHSFRRGLKRVAASWYNGESGQSRLRKSITTIMLELLVLSRESGIWPQRDVIKYIRSAIALDGLVKTFAPGVDIGLHLEQACERNIKWDLMRNLVSPEVLTGWFGGYAHLARDGFLRAFAILRHTGTERVPGAISTGENPPRKNGKHRGAVLQLAWVALCLAMMWIPPKFSTLQMLAPVLLLIISVFLWQRHSHRAAGA